MIYKDSSSEMSAMYSVCIILKAQSINFENFVHPLPSLFTDPLLTHA